MNIREKNAFTAADFVRHFAQARVLATKEPVFVTNHGRATHVLLDVDEFSRLSQGHAESSANPLRIAFDLADEVDQAMIVFDYRGQVIFANRIACAVTRSTFDRMVGEPIDVALPGIDGSLLELHGRRTFFRREPTVADIPSPFQSGAWLRFRSTALDDMTVVMFRDITEEVESHRLADVKAAIIDAMSLHGGIGYARLSVRATIDRVDTPFCELLGLPEERLVGTPLTDLIAVGHRSAFRAALEQVLRGGDGDVRETSFLTNRGETVDVHAAMVPLKGAYGYEGAIVVMTTLG